MSATPAGMLPLALSWLKEMVFGEEFVTKTRHDDEVAADLAQLLANLCAARDAERLQAGMGRDPVVLAEGGPGAEGERGPDEHKDAAPASVACDCGWPLPRGLQLLTGGMEFVFLACGKCGLWWQLTSVLGGWALSSERPSLSAPNIRPLRLVPPRRAAKERSETAETLLKRIRRERDRLVLSGQDSAFADKCVALIDAYFKDE